MPTRFGGGARLRSDDGSPSRAAWALALVGLGVACGSRPVPPDEAVRASRSGRAQPGGAKEPTAVSEGDLEPASTGGSSPSAATAAEDDRGAMPAESSVPSRDDSLRDVIVGPEGPPCDAVAKVFQVSCTRGGDCHVGTGIGDFAVGSAQAFAYVGKLPNLNSPGCGKMIDPDNPLESLILTKVTGDYPYEPDDCRTLMPPPFGGVTDEQIACLESWLWQFRR